MKVQRILPLCALLILLLSIPARADHADTDIPYAVTGGNIWFDTTTGSITDCDDGVTEAVIPEVIGDVTVRAIDAYAFMLCTYLKKVDLPETVTSIRYEAFWNCLSLQSIIIPESVTHIGESAFGACGLRSFDFPSGITVIEANVLQMCNALLDITIPVGVKKIKNGICSGCSELLDVYYAGTQAQWNAIEMDETSNEQLLDAKLHFEDIGPNRPDLRPITVELSNPIFGVSVPLVITGNGTKAVNFVTAYYDQNRHFAGLESIQKMVYPGLRSVFVPLMEFTSVPAVKIFALDEAYRPLTAAVGQGQGNTSNLSDKYAAILSESDSNLRSALVNALTEQEAKDFITHFADWLR